MPALDAAAFLSAWEDAIAGPPVYRAIRMLAAAWPARPLEEWLRCRIGLRDAALLDLQDAMFGSALETVADCPSCRERVELAFETCDVRVGGSNATEGLDRIVVEKDGYTVTCRLPNSDDLLRLPHTSVVEARDALLKQCLEDARLGGALVQSESLPDPLVSELITRMADSDPQAEVRIALECPECGHRWSMDFDIASYLWTEVCDWARRMIDDVHSLARAYGWSEHDVLAMSPQRRSLYLDRLEGL